MKYLPREKLHSKLFMSPIKSTDIVYVVTTVPVFLIRHTYIGLSTTLPFHIRTSYKPLVKCSEI